MWVRESFIDITSVNNGFSTTVWVSPEQSNPVSLRQSIKQYRNDDVLAVTRGEQERGTGRFIWPAGGCIPVLLLDEGVYVSLVERDGEAPSHQHMLSASSGVGENRHEALNPRLVGVREGVEEVVIQVGDEWCIPTLSSQLHSEIAFDAVQRITDIWENASNDTSQINGPHPDNLAKSSTRVRGTLRQLGLDSVDIHACGKRSSVTGKIVFDFENNSVDLVDALVVDLSHVSIDDIRLYDGEIFDGRMLNREVFLFELSELESIISKSQATAYRRYRGGNVWSESGWVKPDSKYASPVPVDTDPVPSVKECITDLCSTFQF